MFGIAGEISFDGTTPSLSRVDKMLSHLESNPDMHRYVHLSGPISFCALYKKNALPYLKADTALGLTLLFQGFIHNLDDLAKELRREGVALASQNTTDVLLGAFHLWGDGCFARFNGRFAIAIYDHQKQQTHLARDVLGLEPLYLAQDVAGKGLRFGSNLPMLGRLPDIDSSLDPLGLHNFLSFNSAVPAPFTLLKGVKKLVPGTIARFDHLGRRENKVFRRVKYTQNPATFNLNSDEQRAFIKVKLQQAIDNIPTPRNAVLFRSGPEDNLLHDLMQRSKGKTASLIDIHFSHRKGNGEGMCIRPRDVLEAIPAAIPAMSEPAVSSEAMYFFCAAPMLGDDLAFVNPLGFRECLAVHPWYQPLALSNNAARDYARMTFGRTHGELQNSISPALRSEDFSLSFLSGHFELEGAQHNVERAIRFDIGVNIVDGPMSWMTSYARSRGMDVHAPFLDPDFIEGAMSLPASVKHEIVDDLLQMHASVGEETKPSQMMEVPPLMTFLDGGLNTLLQDVLNSSAAKSRPVFEADFIAAQLADGGNSRTPLGASKLFQAGMLELWLQGNGL